MTDQQLKDARNLAGSTYLGAYVHLMCRALKVDDSDMESVNAMALQLVEPLNLGVEAGWRALMGDTVGMDQTLDRLRRHLDEITPIIS